MTGPMNLAARRVSLSVVVAVNPGTGILTLKLTSSLLIFTGVLQALIIMPPPTVLTGFEGFSLRSLR